ncbi:hypothetical protein QUB56_15180 [Microcoleus sp. AR_TQ3_B6]|uniref:hypothetical protein n=1 Tax=Microcoleus sp. AR_TQ3_B6 TaxID=3055284 RepID=UPI002FD67C57
MALPAFKIHWQLLDWEKYPSIGEIEIRLILYKGRSESDGIGVAAALLNQRAICSIDVLPLVVLKVA